MLGLYNNSNAVNDDITKILELKHVFNWINMNKYELLWIKYIKHLNMKLKFN